MQKHVHASVHADMCVQARAHAEMHTLLFKLLGANNVIGVTSFLVGLSLGHRPQRMTQRRIINFIKAQP